MEHRQNALEQRSSMFQRLIATSSQCIIAAPSCVLFHFGDSLRAPSLNREEVTAASCFLLGRARLDGFRMYAFSKSSIFLNSTGSIGSFVFRLSGNAVKISISSLPAVIGWSALSIVVVDIFKISCDSCGRFLCFSVTGVRFVANNKVCSCGLDVRSLLHPPGYTPPGTTSRLIGGRRHGS